MDEDEMGPSVAKEQVVICASQFVICADVEIQEAGHF